MRHCSPDCSLVVFGAVGRQKPSFQTQKGAVAEITAPHARHCRWGESINSRLFGLALRSDLGDLDVALPLVDVLEQPSLCNVRLLHQLIAAELGQERLGIG